MRTKNYDQLFLILISTFLFGISAFSQECQTSSSNPTEPAHIPSKAINTAVDPEVTVYKSIDEAAVAALIEAASQGKNKQGFEFGGCIFSNNKTSGTEFYYTRPVSNSSNDGFKASCLIPAFAPHLVGMYHTHPAEQNFDGFSDYDLKLADHLNITSYIASMYTMNIRRYVSCKTKKVCIDSGGGICRSGRFSPGERVGKITF